MTTTEAYQLGRIDALEGASMDRFTHRPFTGSGPTPDGCCACTASEAPLWKEFRRSYVLGFTTEAKRIQRAARVRPA